MLIKFSETTIIKRFFKSSNGMTLIEVMIIAAILAGLAVVVMNLTQQTSTATKKFQTDIDADFITKEISGMIADPGACKANFAGKNAASYTTPAIEYIKDIDHPIGATPTYNTIKYRTNTAKGFGLSNLVISSYTISNSSAAFPEIADPDTETALVITFQQPASVKQPVKPRRIKISYAKDGSGNITECRSAWLNIQDYWTKSKQTGYTNDIFYMNNVGIGTDRPKGAISFGDSHSNAAGCADAPHGYVWNAACRNDVLLIYQGTEDHYGLGIHGSTLEVFAAGNVEIGRRVSDGTGNYIAAIHVNANTYVGLSNTAPAHKLDITNGSARADAFIVNSDIRLKEQIRPIESALEKIDTLRGVTYKWNELAKDKGLIDERRQMGLIAQEVEKVFPEAVKKGSDDIKTVNYQILVAPLIESVKNLHKQNKQQQKEINLLKKENATLKTWICSQEKKPSSCN